MATFKLIRPDKRSLEPDQDRLFLLSIPITIAICALSVWFNLVGLLVVLIGVGLLLKLTGILRRSLKDWPREKDVIGELRVDEHGLMQIRDGEVEQVLYKNIRSALLEHNHIKGEPLGPRDIAHNGIASLHMTFQNGHEQTIKFLVERKEQVPDVESLLRTMYTSGISLKEYAGRLRLKTILFKHGRSFQEIQALKKELGVDGFY